MHKPFDTKKLFHVLNKMEKEEIEAFRKPPELLPGYKNPYHSPIRKPKSPSQRRPKTVKNSFAESRLINYRPPSAELEVTKKSDPYIEGIDPALFPPKSKDSHINVRVFNILPEVIQEASKKEDLMEYRDIIVPPLYEVRPHGNLTASGVHNSDYYFKLGFRYRTEGNYSKSYYAYRQSIKINPLYYPGWFNLGYTQSKLGQHEDALSSYTYALKYHNKKNALIHYNLGFCLCELQRYEEAIDCFSNALEINEMFLEALKARAICYRKLWDYNAAAQDYVQIKKILAKGIYFGRTYMTHQKKYIYSNQAIYDPSAVKEHPPVIEQIHDDDEEESEDESLDAELSRLFTA